MVMIDVKDKVQRRAKARKIWRAVFETAVFASVFGFLALIMSETWWAR